MPRSWYESTARERVAALVDDGSLIEYLPPQARATSPHLSALDAPAAFDDGVLVGEATLNRRPVMLVAQEGGFMGGAVGEVHGAKIVGLLERALDRRPDAVLLLLESGGVRLHEANAGLIGVAEIMRAALDLRAAGIPLIVLNGGRYGIFGGMGIVARLCDRVIISEQARLGLSGPEVIETTMGVEEFDASDRALVWRTVGGKGRYILGEADVYVADSLDAFRVAAIEAMDAAIPLDLALLQREQQRLTRRLQRFGETADAVEIWRDLGIEPLDSLAVMDTAAFQTAVGNRRLEL